MPEVVEESLDIGVTAPFEKLAITVLEVWERARANMDPEIRKGWDAEGLLLYKATAGRIVRQLEKLPQ